MLIITWEFMWFDHDHMNSEVEHWRLTLGFAQLVRGYRASPPRKCGIVVFRRQLGCLDCTCYHQSMATWECQWDSGCTGYNMYALTRMT
jgi:hypothetical protein